MSRHIRADFVRMFRSLEFMACALFSLALGLLNMLFCLVMSSPSYRSTFENDLFNMSKAVVIISAVTQSMTLYSLAMIAVTVAVGAAVFGRKNLK